MSTDAPCIPGYEVLSQLGQGGMGTVYLAWDVRLERRVALKLLSRGLADDAGARRRFLLEARAAASLEHPNICTIYTVDETPDGQVYIAMSYYEGQTLQQRLVDGPLSTREAVGCAADIARGLAKAHDKGIIHRDIKPANVMLPTEGGLKILDFGVAKLPGSDLTRTGFIVGTASYMSPEQTRGEPVDHRTDIWALGVVLYEMLTGRRPFSADSAAAVMYAIIANDPAPLSSWRADLPGVLDSLIRRMLSKQASDRPGSAGELAQELGALAALLGADSAPSERPSTVTLEGERRAVALLAARLDGYDQLVERLAPEEAERILSRIRSAALDVAEAHNGRIDHFEGDDLLCLFGLEASEEDDAVRAADAANALIVRVGEVGQGLEQRLGVPLRVRAAVHVGTLVVRPGRTPERRWQVSGGPIAVATRLAGEAEPGAVRLSPECQRLIEPFARSTLTPFAGREAELGTLKAALASARRGEGQVVAIVGEAGVGRTRLLGEFRARFATGGVRILTGRCHPRGQAYRPFIEVLGEALELSSHDGGVATASDIVARVRALDPALLEFVPFYLHLLAIGPGDHPLPRHLHGEHLQAALNDALAAFITAGAAREVVTVLVIEDLQWADAASRTVLKQLAEITPAPPMLLAATSRVDVPMDWGCATPVTIHLGSLDREGAESVIRAMLQADRVDPALADWLRERTGGNPFFLEEACRSLLEEGAVKVEGGSALFRRPDQPLHLPDTVQAVIRARVDRLDPATREILRVASVLGRDFGQGLLEQVLGRPSGLPLHLERLKAAGLVQQTRVTPQPVYRFKHAVTHEVVYDSLLEHQRRTLHGVTGRAIEQLFRERMEQLVRERIEEHFATLADHFSRAEEWRAAAHYGLQTARRAANSGRFAEALEILDRARGWLARLPEDAEQRGEVADVLLLQERVCETLGLRERQQQLIDEVIALLPPNEGSSRLAEAHLRQGDLFTLLGRFDRGAAALETSLRLSRERGDPTGEGNALRSLGLLRWHEGRNEEALRYAEQAASLDRERGDLEAIVRDLHNLGTILKGMKAFDRAIACLQEAQDLCVRLEDPIKQFYSAHTLANVHRELGHIEVAEEYLRRADEIAVARRMPVERSFTLVALAHIALQKGAPEEATRLYREAVETSRKARHAEGLAQALRMLGEVLVGLGSAGEALPYFQESAELFAQLHDPNGQLEALEGMIRAGRQAAGTAVAQSWCTQALALAEALDDAPRQAWLHNLLGIAAWERGDFTDALGHYEAALAQVRRMDQRADEGVILNSLGVTLSRLGRHEEACRVLNESVTLNEATGERLLLAHALAALGEASAATGRAADARRCYERAAAIRRDLGDAEAADRLARRIQECA
ncbi:MAG TPA: tetratricopeptide repeat protein [Gemmatimonadales bacterium]|nr:tetratricopeptide repeat protein [Gemmatimonadales bacterium]